MPCANPARDLDALPLPIQRCALGSIEDKSLVGRPHLWTVSTTEALAFPDFGQSAIVTTETVHTHGWGSSMVERVRARHPFPCKRCLLGLLRL